MGNIVNYWLEQLKPITDLTQVKDLSSVTRNPFLKEIEANKPETEDYFYSSGYDNSIIRYKQAKESYGLECNACTVMYLLQSYGAIPYNMNRKEFEHAFTPLTPSEFYKGDFISIAGKKQTVRPIDLFTGIMGKDIIDVGLGLVTRTENILRGSNKITSPLSPNVDAIGTLNKIVDAFQNARKKGYDFTPAKTGFKSNAKFKNLYNELTESSFQPTYFKEGNTIYVGISMLYSSQSLDHYVLIVRDALSFLEKNGKKYYLYPVDDAWHGKAFIFAPNPATDGIDINYWTDNYKNITENSGILYYKNQLLFTVSSNFAIGQ